jgi:Protein kinase G tetratricopeptide repeat
VAGLPVPQVDSADPAAGYLATLSTMDPGQRTAALRAAVSGEPGTSAAVAESAETHLALARSLIVTGDLAGAENALENLTAAALADWRTAWYQGLRRLAAGRPDEARAAFDGVYDALPGELAPKLALGFAAEAAGDGAAAARWFQLVWTVDRSYVSAAFGLARTRLEAGDRAAAVAALAAVPETSSHHLAAQIAAVRIQVSPSRHARGPVSADDLQRAGHRLGRLKLDTGRQLHLTTEVLRAALDCSAAGGLGGGGQLLGCDLSERSPGRWAAARMATASHAAAGCHRIVTTTNSTWACWPASPIAACGITGTRTRWPWPPRSWPAVRPRSPWCAMGCPAQRVRTRRRPTGGTRASPTCTRFCWRSPMAAGRFSTPARPTARWSTGAK